jgi:RimJ/RimL family protein N-acetyltransferase
VIEVEAPRREPAPDTKPGVTAEGGVVIARGQRVYLRTLAPGDLDYLSEWAENPFLERMVGSEFLRAYKHAYDKHPSFYEACLNDPTQVVLVITAVGRTKPRAKKPLGLVRLFNIHLIEGYAFLETLLTDEKALRRGFGVEAGKLVCAYGLDVLGLRRIEAKVYEYNLLSINSLRRHGFRQEGVLRKAGYYAGQHFDVLVFGILREELEEQRKKEVDQEHFHFPYVSDEGPGEPP